jgi:hypothetical protein
MRRERLAQVHNVAVRRRTALTVGGFRRPQFEYVTARPDDGYLHLGAGRAFRRLTLCDRPARRLWWGSGRVCPACNRLAPPWSEQLRDESRRARREAHRALEVGDIAKAERLRQVADALQGRADGLER